MNTTIRRSVNILVILVATAWALGCASTPSSDPWIITYVGSPDDVWVALHIALVELDYDVESENREDGVLRAVRAGDDSGTEILSIDQITRAGEVKVYIRAAAGPGEPAMSGSRQEKNAKDFLALVNGVLFK